MANHEEHTTETPIPEQEPKSGGGISESQYGARPPEASVDTSNAENSTTTSATTTLQGRKAEALSTKSSIFKDTRFWIGLISGTIIGVVVSVGGLSLITAHEATVKNATEQSAAAKKKKHADAVLERAYGACQSQIDHSLSKPDTLDLEDGNKTLHLTSPNSALNTYETYHCVAEKVNMPESTQNKIGQTTSLAGMQSDSWDNLKATWTYRGSDGLDLTIERK